MLTAIGDGNIVKDYMIGNTRVKICDDYSRDRTKEEVNTILRRISRRVQEELSAAADEKQ